MYKIREKDITMYEGDFGERLPISIIEGDILPGDILKFIIKDHKNNKIVEKQLSVVNNKFEFFLTEQETKLLPEGKYMWGLIQYREGLLIDTLTANNTFEVIRGQ